MELEQKVLVFVVVVVAVVVDTSSVESLSGHKTAFLILRQDSAHAKEDEEPVLPPQNMSACVPWANADKGHFLKPLFVCFSPF